jgi:hypothetical protein
VLHAPLAQLLQLGPPAIARPPLDALNKDIRRLTLFPWHCSQVIGASASRMLRMVSKVIWQS